MRNSQMLGYVTSFCCSLIILKIKHNKGDMNFYVNHSYVHKAFRKMNFQINLYKICTKSDLYKS